MPKRAITIVIHIACWLLYLFLPVVFSPGFGPHLKGVSNIMGYPLHFFLMHVSLIPFFYINSYFLIPKLFFHKGNILYFVCVVIFFLLFVSIPFPDRNVFIIRGNMPPPPSPAGFDRPRHMFFGFRIMPRIFPFLIVWLVSTMIQVVQRWQQAEKRSKENELEKVSAELSYLKLQINPHFLFNTLNNIYSLASVQSSQTPAAVMKLSEIMRYVIQDAQADHVPLEKEIQYLSNYIELQKMRSTDKLALRFETSGNMQEYSIAPLLLISFVENAFKYGISNHEKTFINISINVSAGILTMLVVNKIIARTEDIAATSIGMLNTRRRLDLLYPDKHALKVEKTADMFTVDLKIELV